MTGGVGGRRRFLTASTVPAVETALVVVTLAVLGASGADWPLPEWALLLAPTLLAPTVLAHRLPQLWRAVRGTNGSTARVSAVWAGLEALFAAGFLGVLVVVVVGVLGTLGTAVSGDFATAGAGIGFVVGSAVVAGFFAFFLVLAVGGRLAVGGLLRLVRRSGDG